MKPEDRKTRVGPYFSTGACAGNWGPSLVFSTCLLAVAMAGTALARETATTPATAPAATASADQAAPMPAMPPDFPAMGEPAPPRTQLHELYLRLHRFTLAWPAYVVAFLLLLTGVVWHKRWPRLAGLALLGLGTAFMLAGFLIRWRLAGRPWYLPPVTGQFEVVTSTAMFAALVSLVLEGIRPRSFFALAGALVAAAAGLCAFLFAERMNAEIAPVAGVLNNWILPLHVGTIILGYVMIGMGLVISLAYLLAGALPRVRSAGAARSAGADLSADPPAGLLAELDRCNLIAAQLACWLVGAGTVLGAYWADYSWGRWWGFDAKETWALITWIVYLGIIHLRYLVPARTRGAWTAGLTVAGAAVMFFNWVIVTYYLPSLHGYA